ncbi:hypothetical protein C2I36_06510 [Rhodobacteraceae bacterium WD3A24]|nr:hypothetical protein C2I36_06510 [Rhodobacteraceae bacterium WD3A24]
MADRLNIHPAEGVWVVRAGGAIIAESRAALQLDETGYEPVIYFPRDDIAMAFLEPSETTTSCPHKGAASYFHITGPGTTLRDAAWSYDAPLPGAAGIGGYLAFDPEQVTVERL